MDAIVWFRYGPVHVPPGRRKWTDGPRIEVVKGGRTYELQIRRPVRIHTHEIEYESGIKKIVDAYLIFAVGCQIIDTPDGYREVADVALIYTSTILERLRVRTRQPHLQLRSISELSVPEVQHADGKQNQELTRRFQEWMLDQEGDRPLPELEIGEWNQLKSNADCGIEFSE